MSDCRTYIEMSDSHRNLMHICDTLEYAHAELSIGISGEIRSEYSVYDVNTFQKEACLNLEKAIEQVINLIGAYKE